MEEFSWMQGDLRIVALALNDKVTKFVKALMPEAKEIPIEEAYRGVFDVFHADVHHSNGEVTTFFFGEFDSIEKENKVKDTLLEHFHDAERIFVYVYSRDGKTKIGENIT